MRRDLWIATVLMVMIVLVTLAGLAIGDEPVAVPVVPSDAPLIYDQIVQCSPTHGMYNHGYDTRGHHEQGSRDYDVLVLGVFTPPNHVGEALVHFVYGGVGNMDVTEVYLTLPGKPAERITWSTLLARWPRQCDLIRELFDAGERGLET